MSSNHEGQSSIGLLSLDDGHWESLSPLSQIAIIEDIISYYESDQDIEAGTIKPCDIFDLIVGTGTGGLVACMLGVLKMSTDEAKQNYVRFYELAFKPDSTTQEERAADLRYALEQLLDTRTSEDMRFERKMSSITLLEAEKLSPKCKCAFTASAAARMGFPIFFRAYRGRNSSIQCTLLEALLATISDYEAFPPVEINNERFISTTPGMFNPTESLIKEAGTVFRSKAIAAIVSIGPGRPPLISVDGLGGFPDALLYRSMDCQAASERTESRYRHHPGFYTRFEVDTLDLEKPDLKAKPTSWERVFSHSRTYLSRSDIQDRLSELRRTLINRPSQV
ncbi:hypothetical protein DL96DRAFT_1817192 [Flagelloscypha sp. PMI_526]|nr:hypothetical protein DL96DRAFT_1817192 [Flagelloscypha sp. PMI_526]